MTSRRFALSRHRRRRSRAPRDGDAAEAGARALADAREQAPADDRVHRPYADALEHAPDRAHDAAAEALESASRSAGARPDAPALPHEHDEHADAPAPPRAPIVQAERDLAEGRVDTDLRRMAREVFERALAPRRR